MLIRQKFVVTSVVPQWISDVLCELAHHQCVGPNEAARQVIVHTQSTPEIIDWLSPTFIQDYQADGRVWTSSHNYRSVTELLPVNFALTQQFRISMTRQEWFRLDNLGYAMCQPDDLIASALLQLGVQTDAVMMQLAPALRVAAPSDTSIINRQDQFPNTANW